MVYWITDISKWEGAQIRDARFCQAKKKILQL